MIHAQQGMSSEFEAKHAVSTVLSHYGSRDVISTGNALRRSVSWRRSAGRPTRKSSG